MGRVHGTCNKCHAEGLDPEKDYYSSVSAWCKDCFRDYQTGRHATVGRRTIVRRDKAPRITSAIEFVPPGMDKKDYVKSLIKSPLGIPEQMQQALQKGKKRNLRADREPTSLAELPSFVKINADPGASYALEIASMIKSGTDNGKKIIEFWLRVLYDESVPLKYRFAVSQELANRLFGRPPQEIVASVDVNHKAIQSRVQGLTDAELAGLNSPADLDRYITIEAVSRVLEEVRAPQEEDMELENSPDPDAPC